MSHNHAALALLVLSLPYALAVPLAQANGVKPLLPALQLLGNSWSARAGSAATPSPVLNLAAPLNAVNSIIAPINALLAPPGVSTISSVSVSTATTVTSASTSVPSLSTTSISLPAVSSTSISVPTLTSALTSVIELPSVALDSVLLSVASEIAASVASDVASLADIVADITTTVDVTIPTTAASDISSLTGGILTSPDVTSPDATSPEGSVESTSTDEPTESLIPDPEFQGGPENELINPIPNPIGPTPTPIDEADNDITETDAPDALETEAAPLDDSTQSEAVEISEPVPTVNVTVLLNSTLANSSEPTVTEAPTAVLLAEPTDDVSIDTSDDFVIPLETEIPAPFANTTVILNGTVANSTVTTSIEPVITDEPAILLPEPTDDIFIDPLLPTDDVLIDPNTDLPIETDLPLPEEPDVTDTSFEPVELFNPPKDSVELSTFVRIMQGIADVISNIFHVIPPEEAEAEPAVEDVIAEDTVPGVPEPELNIPDVPIPLINATENATILERRQLYGTTGATPPLDPVIVSDIMRSVLEIITTIFQQVTKAVPAVAAAIPDLPVALPSINPKLPTTILPILPTEAPQLDLPTDIDWNDLPGFTTDLPNVGLPSVALSNIALPSLAVLPSLAAAVLPTDIPIDLPTGVPDDLLADLAGIAPVAATLPPLEAPTALTNILPTGVADLPTELPTDLPADLFSDLPTELPTDLGALADGVTRLAKRASRVMTAEQEQLLSVIHANNAELQEALEQLKALQQGSLRKRQSAGAYAGAEAGFTGPQLFPVILNLINTLLGIVNGLTGVQTIAPNDLNSLLAGALASAGVFAPGTPVVPVTGLGGLGSLGGLEAPIVPVPSGSVVPVFDGALGSLGGLAAPLVSGVPPVVPSLVPGVDLAALGSLGGLAAPLVSGLPVAVPSLAPGLDLGALGSLGGLAAPVVSGVPAVVPSLVPGVDLGALGSLGGLAAPVVSVVSQLPSILPIKARGEALQERQLIGSLGGLGSVGGLGGVIGNTRSSSATGGVISPATPLAAVLGAVSPVASPVVNLLNGLLAGGSAAGLAPVVNSVAGASVVPSPSAVVNALGGLLAGGSAAGLAGVASSLPLVSGLPVVNSLPLVGDLPVVNSLPVTDLLQNVGPLPVVSPVAGVVNDLVDSTLPGVPDIATLPTANPLAILGDIPAVASPIADVVGGLLDSSLPELPNVASLLPVASTLPALLDTVPGTDAVSDAVNGLLAGNSAAGLTPPVGDVSNANGLLPPVIAVDEILKDLLPDTSPFQTGVAPPVGDIVKPLLDPVGAIATPLLDPVGAIATPLLSGVGPILAPLPDIAAPLTQGLSPILNAAPTPGPQLPGLDTLLAPVVDPLKVGEPGGLRPLGPPILDALNPVTNPAGSVLAPATPVTGTVFSILPEIALKQIQGVLQTLKRLLGVPDSRPFPIRKRDAPVSVVPVLPQPQIFASLEHDSINSVPDNAAHAVKAPLGAANDKRHEELTKHPQAPVEKRQIYNNAAVKKFMSQWHTIGASMAKVDPGAVSDLMQVFLDPSSNPPTPAALSKYAESLRNFILSFYTFATYMDDAGVTPEEKIVMLRIMFDTTSMNSGFKKTKRSMRFGRRQLWTAEDGEPDTGPSLDDADKLGHNALSALLGPQGSLDPLELFRPQDRVYDPIDYFEEAEPTEESTSTTDDSDVVDDSAWGDDAASTEESEPTEEEYADYLDYFGDSH